MDRLRLTVLRDEDGVVDDERRGDWVGVIDHVTFMDEENVAVIVRVLDKVNIPVELWDWIVDGECERDTDSVLERLTVAVDESLPLVDGVIDSE